MSAVVIREELKSNGYKDPTFTEAGGGRVHGTHHPQDKSLVFCL